MTRFRALVCIPCVVAALGGCGSSAGKGAAPAATDPPTSRDSTTAPAPNSERGDLEFREVIAQYPWAPDSVEPAPTAAASGSAPVAFPGCEKLIAQSPPDTPDAEEVVLPDRLEQSCHVVGPALITGRDVGSASVLYDPTSSQSAVTLHFDNDDFVKKVAEPLVGKQVAIALDGSVLSAPMINPGITGREVQISGAFTKEEATAAAAAIAGVPPSSIKVDSTDAPD